MMQLEKLLSLATEVADVHWLFCQIALIQGDSTVMQRHSQWANGRPDEILMKANLRHSLVGVANLWM
jgi:hypothetical protein